ncbi:hypothetical protein OR1_01726 [Geobacter sp. OR-1]|uniref:DUF4403 family protein n=1 Tax=Geobacter sp. OR-1 TaxID=1266765 RepID=UPI000541E743|nr:DUF4403 family protein [Geobacter sp. OR-1]GAM09447.1 hypothetical protein OR1_01726 [Geobacter sp. OR-1]
MRQILHLFSLLALLLLASTICEAAGNGVQSSTIILKVETTAADLGNILNQSIKKELYKGQGSLGTSVEILRAGSVAVTAANDFVYISIPVQLTIGYGMFTTAPLKTDLRFKAKVSVSPDWRLKTELYYTGLSDGLSDSIRLGMVTLKPKSLVEGVTQPVQRLLAPVIDNKINDTVRLREKITPVWQNAFNPVLVDKNFSAWLRMSPEKILMSPISATNNRLRLSIGLVTIAEIVIGPKPGSPPVRPLPQIQQLANFDNQFHIQLGTNIFFADLVTALNPILINKTFGDDKKITVRSFSLKSDDGRLVIDLAATGDFDGELTLLAKPVYNPENNSLTFDNIDFDTRNAGLLIGVGSWLFNGTIRNVIKDKLNTTIVEQLESARLKASAALAKIRLADHVELSGTVKSLRLGEAIVASDRLSLQVTALGESGISLK